LLVRVPLALLAPLVSLAQLQSCRRTRKQARTGPRSVAQNLSAHQATSAFQACSLACSEPLRLEIELLYPVFEISSIQGARTNPENSCCVLYLPLRLAQLGPLELGDDHVLCSRDV